MDEIIYNEALTFIEKVNTLVNKFNLPVLGTVLFVAKKLGMID